MLKRMPPSGEFLVYISMCVIEWRRFRSFFDLIILSWESCSKMNNNSMYNRGGQPKFTRSTNPRGNFMRVLMIFKLMCMFILFACTVQCIVFMYFSGHQQMHQQRLPSDRLDMRENPMNGRMRNEPNYSTGMPPHVQSSHQYHAADMRFVLGLMNLRSSRGIVKT